MPQGALSKTGLARENSLSGSWSGYPALLRLVRQTLLLGRQKIEQAKVEAYWQAGKYIHEHILRHQKRAEYGEEVVGRLAKDLSIDKSVLRRAAGFAQTFEIGAARHQLTWAHYRELITVKDEEIRLSLLERAAHEKWTSRQLVRKIKFEAGSRADGRAAAAAKAPAALPGIVLGPFYTYRIIRPEIIHPGTRETLVDLGFGHTVELEALTEKRFPEGTIITSVKDARGRYRLEKAPGPAAAAPAGNEPLYTYKAYVEKVIDGDTLKVEFQLGFGNRKHETIRLNHINCPESGTREGAAAKRFVEARLAPCEFITIKSVKTRKEKWGRYLGDVFFQDPKAAAPVYLNQLLLDQGRAVRVRM